MGFHQVGLLHSTYLCVFSFFFLFFLLFFHKVCRNSEPFLLEGEFLPLSHVPELPAQGVPQPRDDPAYLGLPGTVSCPSVGSMEEGV